MLVEPVTRELTHRRPLRGLRRHRLGHRVLARLDARHDERRATARLLGRDHAVAPHRHPRRRLAASPGLHGIDLAPRRIHPNPESSRPQNTVSFSTFSASTVRREIVFV